MGAWGTKLYEDDLALDVKEEYTEKLKNGLKNEDALGQILEEYKSSIEDSDEAPIFWLALADTMWKLGRLTERVKKEAIKNIKLNLRYWKQATNTKEYESRQKELEKLKEKLNSKMPEEVKFIKKSTKEVRKRKYEWNIGDVYAYQLKGEKAKELGLYGKYLIFRKVDDGLYNKKTIGAIVYIQITKSDKLPKTKEELEELEYIIISNEGNVRHEYVAEIYTITQKIFREELKYIGNFPELYTPEDEYRDCIKMNIRGWRWEYIETHFLDSMIKLGTNKHPIYYEVDPKDISDSHTRFLMRVRYYEEKLEIIPPEEAIVKNDPLLYIALVDSMMIGGFVRNPVGIVNEEVKQEAYKRIEKLKEIIISKNDKSQNEKIQILDELREKIEKYQFSNPFFKLQND